MTLTLLQTIAKARKINLDWYDEINSSVIGKFVYLEFSNRINAAGCQCHVDTKLVRLSIIAIYKREEFEDDYLTNGWQFISDLDK